MRRIGKFVGGEIDQEWANEMRTRFLQRTQDMTYEEAKSEIPQFLGIFRQIYPERCPPEILLETPSPKLEAIGEQKYKKSPKDENQLNLFN